MIYDVFVTVTGICILAPLFLPVIIRVAYNAVLFPYKALTVVAVKVTDVPITVFETLVPKVSDEFNFEACSVAIPVPVKSENIHTSEIVAVYPSPSD